MFVVEFTRGRDERHVISRTELDEPNLFFALERATALLFNSEDTPDGYRVFDRSGRLCAELWAGTVVDA